MAFITIKSFAEISHRYDGFILDQFGVMHNGSRSLPGSEECVKKLVAMGKKLIILSNTSSPASSCLEKLPKLGFDRDQFVGAVTSGEEASGYIRGTYGGGNVPKKAIWFTWDEPDVPLAFISKCGNVEGTTNIQEADFIIAHGSNVLRSTKDGSDNVTLGSYMDDGDFSLIDPVLEECLSRRLPMVCANPDLIVKLPGDVTANMPGKIAKKYEAMGGNCKYFGKPYAGHFKACLREMGLDANRVCHVGDSLQHDILGANEANIANVFISGGIHCDYFDCDIGEIPTEDSLASLFEEEGVIPTYVSPLFQF